ncbi:MAG: bifunctional DNA-formamidopyrimidine glycosylase/DNA-(apurinic or apyrimidinic site) lyase [Proteobacteria bacterium]|nr:bifunctional DNA-formamidopyrimidine glycosylase/DNA-(apurinic or apyrimidinic site) lyase [Pseudomonadota bacterium]
MPELPEVETVRLGLAGALEGERLIRVEARRPDLRFPLPQGFERALSGRKVIAVDRRGKFLLIRLDGELTVIAHLGMSGRFRIFTAPPPALERHDHVIFETDGGVTVRFNDPRRFGFMDMVATGALDRHPMLAALGPEPLTDEFDGPALAASLKGRRTSIKAALMDQSVVAGLGNIYASEVLFRAGLSPRRKAANVQGGRARKLVRAIKAVLTEAIAAGGSSFRDHRRPDGELGYFQHAWAVYGRQGKTCPGCDCDPARTGGIRRIKQSGRSTFYCASRQR